MDAPSTSPPFDTSQQLRGPNKFLRFRSWFQRYLVRNGQPIYNQPALSNKAGSVWREMPQAICDLFEGGPQAKLEIPPNTSHSVPNYRSITSSSRGLQGGGLYSLKKLGHLHCGYCDDLKAPFTFHTAVAQKDL